MGNGNPQILVQVNVLSFNKISLLYKKQQQEASKEAKFNVAITRS